jgi:truncated hemoglobin YjbI
MSDPTPESAYDRIGGEPSVREAVGRLYRLILGDAELAPYFSGVELSDLKQHMVSLLTKVLGGPDGYTGRDLALAHQHLQVTSEHFFVVGVYLLSVLQDLGVPLDIRRTVGTVLASVQPLVITD